VMHLIVGLIGPKLLFWPSCGTIREHYALCFDWVMNMATFSAVI
jgi:hypothetical protein